MKKYLILLSAAVAFCMACEPVDPEPGIDPVVSTTVCGMVKTGDGTGIAGVVVSDGYVCCQTDASGHYALPADLTKAKFVIVSTPSDYSAPVDGGLPVFYKRISELTQSGGVYENVNFTLNKVNNPSRCTLLMTADPQPRSSGANYDKIGYSSLQCCQDMYKDLKETKAGITDRPVYGISLGDIVHENANLYSNYKTGLATVGFPTYNVIGNHDHTYSKEDCEDDYEKHLGPTNYSVNLAGFHIVVLDNMILTLDSASKTYKDVNDGLTDDVWKWLQADLSYVPTSTPLIVCAHSPMVRHNDNQRSGTHYADARALFKQYVKAYQWAGHVHASYNYVDKSDPVLEAHSVTRTTGELWTNEYIGGNGTPRGYILMDLDGTDLSWKFKPIYYQSSSYTGGSKKPSYEYRDWDYNSSNVAVMKDGGQPLNDSYQMHVYKPGVYGDSYVYANVFLWDELWKNPVLTVDGVPTTMTRVTTAYKNYMYDMSRKELTVWYKANSSILSANADYSGTPATCYSMFRAYVSADHGTGKVSVTDRFGNSYSSTITW